MPTSSTQSMLICWQHFVLQCRGQTPQLNKQQKNTYRMRMSHRILTELCGSIVKTTKIELVCTKETSVPLHALNPFGQNCMRQIRPSQLAPKMTRKAGLSKLGCCRKAHKQVSCIHKLYEHDIQYFISSFARFVHQSELTRVRVNNPKQLPGTPAYPSCLVS